jgi:hypothetical protein
MASTYTLLPEEYLLNPGGFNGVNPNVAWIYANYYQIHLMISGLLEGFVAENPVNGSIEYYTSLNLSPLVGDLSSEISFPQNFPQKIVDFLTNVTLSMTYFLLHPISASTDATKPPALYVNTNATIVTYPTRYAYSSSTLWAMYGAAIGSVAVIIALGCYILLKNGVDADMSFSQVMVATRNKSLDDLCVGACLGGANISKDIRNTKLKYGELRGQHHHVCFGKEEEIASLRKRGHAEISNVRTE